MGDYLNKVRAGILAAQKSEDPIGSLLPQDVNKFRIAVREELAERVAKKRRTTFGTNMGRPETIADVADDDEGLAKWQWPMPGRPPVMVPQPGGGGTSAGGGGAAPTATGGGSSGSSGGGPSAEKSGLYSQDNGLVGALTRKGLAERMPQPGSLAEMKAQGYDMSGWDQASWSAYQRWYAEVPWNQVAGDPGAALTMAGAGQDASVIYKLGKWWKETARTGVPSPEEVRQALAQISGQLPDMSKGLLGQG